MRDHFPSPPSWGDEESLGVAWGKTEEVLKGAKVIYAHRSNSLHAGIPFPGPLLRPPLHHDSDKPVGLAVTTLGGTWNEKYLPMYLFAFEHLARGTILDFWKTLTAV